ncbi:MAG: hypothetical protein KC645_18220, partial [Gemmatimonadetes bacterium]|nr:hypothetical protein [Gemmatimonadota bacterium]
LSRRELLWQVGLYLGPESDTRRTTERENHAQLGLDLDDAATRHRFAQVDDRDRLLAEYRMLRFSTAQHPLLFVRDALPADRMLADRFDSVRQHATVTVAGVVVARQRPQTANGFTFILMEDETGPINVIVQPDIYERDRMVVRMEPFILVRGRLRKDGANTNVVAYEVRSLRSEGARADLPEEGPPTLEYWGAAPSASGPAPTRFLSALRSSPPDVKSFG